MKKTFIKHASPISLAVMMLILTGGLLSINTYALNMNHTGGALFEKFSINKDWLWKGKNQVKRGMHEIYGGNINTTIIENQIEKYSLDPQLLQNIIDSQSNLQKAIESLSDEKSNGQNNEYLFSQSVQDEIIDLRTNLSAFQAALQNAKINEAKQLGVDEQIIQNWLDGQKELQNKMDELFEMRMKKNASVEEIKTLRRELSSLTKQSRESRKQFYSAVQQAQKMNSELTISN
jgi:hypothetical protein